MSTDLVDLSVPIVTGMAGYPEDPEVVVTPALTVAGAGVNVLALHLGSQAGTHVDAPFHIDDSLPRLDEIPLSRFVGPAVLLDARGRDPQAEIGPELLSDPVRRRIAAAPGEVVALIVTGWSAHWGHAEYLRHPYPGTALAEALVAAGVRTVGIDALSVDRTPGPGQESSLATHRVLCGAGAVIAENLTRLDRLVAAEAAGRAVEVCLFPLALAGADGAPVRAVARLGPARATVETPTAS